MVGVPLAGTLPVGCPAGRGISYCGYPASRGTPCGYPAGRGISYGYPVGAYTLRHFIEREETLCLE
jgi:hypothetical protein